MSEATVIRDVAETEFAAQVLEPSRSRPVVVDFWAPWCGPCHQLSPLLERVAERYPDVTVVKVNVDEAPTIAREYRIQGIPAVKAFRDGKVAAEFTGVQPEPGIDRFFAGLLPSVADRLVEEARTATGEERARLVHEALAHDPGHQEAARLQAELNLADANAEDLEALQRRASEGSPEAALDLGRALAARGDYESALARLLDAVRDPSVRDEARQAVLDVFRVLGDDHPLVRANRPRLASALF